MTQMYEAVIFDLDGTLIDSSEGIILAVEEAVGILGYPRMEREEIRSYIGPPVGEAIIKRNGLGNDDLIRFNSVFRDIYKNRYLMRAEIYPGVMEMLSDLKDIMRVGIATNKREDYTKILLDGMGISPFCDAVEGLDLEGKLKKKDIVERCINALGVADRKKIAVVGDTVTDARAAMECGTDFIGVTFGFGFRNERDVPFGKAVSDVPGIRRALLG